jgi:mannan endo-1,4-beta-mannosidase
VVALARETRATNTQFVFCANADDVGGVPIGSYWPGASWVDAIGVDGFNGGWKADGSPVHVRGARLTRLHPTARFAVEEIGAAAGPGKADWYHKLHRSRSFPRLTQVGLFQKRKEQDWRIDFEPASLEVNRWYLTAAARG